MSAALAAAGIAAGADIIGGIFSGSSANKRAKQQRAWEERMSNTAYQRQKADLEAAGFNPMLGYMKGSGASTPSGAVAEGTDLRGIGTNATSAYQKAAERKLMEAQIQSVLKEAGLKDSQRNLADRQAEESAERAVGYDLENRAREINLPYAAGNAQVNADRLQAEYNKLVEDVKHVGSQMESERLGRAIAAMELRARELGMPALENQSNIDDSWYGRYVRPVINDAGKILGGVSSAAGAAAGAALGSRREDRLERREEIKKDNLPKRGKNGRFQKR